MVFLLPGHRSHETHSGFELAIGHGEPRGLPAGFVAAAAVLDSNEGFGEFVPLTDAQQLGSFVLCHVPVFVGRNEGTRQAKLLCDLCVSKF